jgi:hypothetical protein
MVSFSLFCNAYLPLITFETGWIGEVLMLPTHIWELQGSDFSQKTAFSWPRLFMVLSRSLRQIAG